MRAEAQNFENSAEYFKTDSVEQTWRLQVGLEAKAVNERTRVPKYNFWLDTVKRDVV